jgi:hypothetical protein
MVFSDTPRARGRLTRRCVSDTERTAAVEAARRVCAMAGKYGVPALPRRVDKLASCIVMAADVTEARR